jgi:hypothetical protein
LKKNKNKKNKIINPPFAFCALHTESSLIASCTVRVSWLLLSLRLFSWISLSFLFLFLF